MRRRAHVKRIATDEGKVKSIVARFEVWPMLRVAGWFALEDIYKIGHGKKIG